MTSTQWIKSSRSGGNGDCVELTTTLDQLRDSKDPHGPALQADVAKLIRAIKSGDFDR